MWLKKKWKLAARSRASSEEAAGCQCSGRFWVIPGHWGWRANGFGSWCWDVWSAWRGCKDSLVWSSVTALWKGPQIGKRWVPWHRTAGISPLHQRLKVPSGKKYLAVAVDTPDWMSGIRVFLQPKRQLELEWFKTGWETLKYPQQDKDAAPFQA